MDFEVQMVILTTFTIAFICGLMGYAYFKFKALSNEAPKSDTFEDDK